MSGLDPLFMGASSGALVSLVRPALSSSSELDQAADDAEEEDTDLLLRLCPEGWSSGPA